MQHKRAMITSNINKYVSFPCTLSRNREKAGADFSSQYNNSLFVPIISFFFKYVSCIYYLRIFLNTFMYL